jgi:hypothetical protein
MKFTTARSLLLTILCLGLLAGASFAAPQAFDWTFVGINGSTISGSGTLLADPLGGGAWQVTSISGTRNGVAITGLTTYAGDDNVVYTTFPQLDYPGLAFTDANGFAYNVFYDTATTDVYNCGFVGYCEIGPGTPGTDGLGPPRDPVDSINFTLTAVPEPGSLALLGTGVLALAGLVRRKLNP